MKKFIFCTLCLFCSHLFGQESKVFEFPMKPGDSSWTKCKSTDERMKELQIPLILLSEIPTSELVDICLDYPYIIQVVMFNSFQDGFERMTSTFNGFKELFSRKDYAESLIKKFIDYPEKLERLKNTGNIKANHLLIKTFLMNYFMLQDDFLNKLDIANRTKLISVYEKYIKVIEDNSTYIGNLNVKLCRLILAHLNNSANISSYFPDGLPWPDHELMNYSSHLVYTPENTTIRASKLDDEDIDSVTKAEIDSIILNAYDDISLVDTETSTYAYNCHGYVWHMVDYPNDPVWIGYPDAYMNDGSYINVSPSIATHLKYPGDHSARKVNGHWVSKLAHGSLVQHSVGALESSYGSVSSNCYYIKAPRFTSLSGFSNSMKTNASYTIERLPANYSVIWSLSNSNWTISSGQGTNSVQLSRLSYGSCILKAIVKVGTITVTTLIADLSVIDPNVQLTLGDIHFVSPSGTEGYWVLGDAKNYFYFSIPENTNFSQYEAQVYKLNDYGNGVLYTSMTFYTNSYMVGSYPTGWYLVKVRGLSNGVYTDWVEGEVEVVDNWTGNFQIVYESTSAVLTINYNSPECFIKSGAKSLISEEYEIRIWNRSSLIKKLEMNQPSLSISLAGLPNGLYIIEITKDKQSFSTKFVKS